MTRYDVFNGDADGLCSRQQMRLAEPVEAVLVTGVKRDNRLLHKVPAREGDQVLALDIALPGNRDALLELLQAGAQVRYVDHHEPGELPSHPNLQLLIDTDPQTCTSVLVDRLLGGAARAWAVVGAYGDNMVAAAEQLANALGLDAQTRTRWRELGECLNYNAYGVTEQDLVYPPAQLALAMAGHSDPDAFISTGPYFERLSRTRHEDLQQASAHTPRFCSGGALLHLLPNADWARRVFGSYANQCVNADPQRAHAVAVPRRGRNAAQEPSVSATEQPAYLVSLRVPVGAARSAHQVCSAFGGGGRARAAGIDALEDLEALAAALAIAFPERISSGRTP
ncbi:MAG: acetyltransferase [Quisquiliibacterium sp.]